MNYRENYKCTECAAEGLRLWREYSMFLDDDSPLLCAACATKRQKKPFFCYEDGSSIGWLVPAVPTPEGDTFWGYTSVPDEDIEWWEAMPTYKDDASELKCVNNILKERSQRLRYYQKKEYDAFMERTKNK